MKFGGVEMHFLDGYFHREDGPAIMTNDAHEYLVMGQYHREDGPARMYKNKENHCEWWLNGKPQLSGKISDEEFDKHWHKE